MNSIMKKLFLLVVPVSMFLGACVATDQEAKLADELTKAQRKVEAANKKSEAAGKKLEDYCKAQYAKQVVRVKPNGLIGCVTLPPAPVAPAKP